jgi:hypothetical protein
MPETPFALRTRRRPSKIVGLATVTDSHGHDVPNPVFEFDGVIKTNS